MTAMTRRLSALLPLLLLALSIGSAARAWPLAGTLAVLAVALFSAGPRLTLDAGRQALSTAIGAGAGYFAAMLLHEHVRGALTEGWTRIASATLLAGAARFLLVAPRSGHLPVVALAFAGMVATGRARDPAYIPLAVCFLLVSVWDLSVKPGLSTTLRRVGAGGAIIAAALALTGASIASLRYLHAKAGRTRYTAVNFQPRVGFSERMELGSLEGLLDSDERVLRVHGPRVDYLRGVSLDLYQSGHWRRSEAAERLSRDELGGERDESQRVVITHQREGGRFFLPLAAADLVTSPATVLSDGLGSIRSTSRRALLRASFFPAPRDRAAPAPPRRTDRMLPRRLRPELEALAREWTRGARGVEQELEAIERRLRTEYSYALRFERRRGRDPLMDFLFESRRGHCEYFASALALLARARGIPARVVMGYRVAERSPFGYYVVRERNAHAWVEAWLPEHGWLTRDATPPGASPQNVEHEASFAASSLDAVEVAYERLTTWIESLTLVETSLAWLTGSLILALIVARGARRKARRHAPAADAEPLPLLRVLLRRLARSGQAHRPDEPLERLAARLPDARARELLVRYAALRYGDQGDADQLARDVDEYGTAARR